MKNWFGTVKKCQFAKVEAVFGIGSTYITKQSDILVSNGLTLPR